MSPAPFLSLHDAGVIAIASIALLALGFGRLPGVRLNRASVAAAGAALMALVEGRRASLLAHAIDVHVLVLLLGLMLVNAGLADAGAFRLVTFAVAAGRAGRTTLLVAVVLVAGVLSALFLNDMVVLMLTAPVVALARRLGAPPLPYLLALAMAANAGSVATLTGNPQNVAVGIARGIGFLPFAAALTPVAAMSLLVVAAAILIQFRAALRPAPDTPRPPLERPALRPLRLAVATGIAAAMLVAFLAGVPVATAAAAAGALALLGAGRRAGALLRGVDLQLLVLFTGLFVVVGGLAATPLAADALAWTMRGGALALSLSAAVASNLISNVPAVLLLLPAAAGGDGARPALTLAMASTLSGNLTLVGSVANLIVAETARRLGVEIDVLAYARVGVPVGLVTLALGTAWLMAR